MLRYTDVYPTKLTEKTVYQAEPQPQPKKEKLQNRYGSHTDSLLSFCTVVAIILVAALANGWQPWVSHTRYNPSTQEGCFARGDKVICVYEAEEEDAYERPTREEETGYPESYPEFLR